MRCATVITPITVALFAGPSRLALDALTHPEAMASTASSSEDEEEESTQKASLKLDGWLMLYADPTVSALGGGFLECHV